MKKCIKCKQDKELSLFRMGKNVCRSCTSIQNKVYHAKPLYLYKSYKYDANRRNIPFLISYEEFLVFQNQKCFYCNDHPDKIGLDRKDNNLGYDKDNIVACCKSCNFLKGSLNTDDFLNLVKKINKAQGFNND